MLRQVGLAVGVSVFVAVVGTPSTQEGSLHAFEHGWTVIALTGFLAAVVGAVVLPNRPAAVGRVGIDPAAGRTALQVD
jgi:hypothetical protein